MEKYKYKGFYNADSCLPILQIKYFFLKKVLETCTHKIKKKIYSDTLTKAL